MSLSRFNGLGWIAIPTLLISLNASAGLEQQLTNCAGISDKLDRLICYDNLAANALNHNVNQPIQASVSKPAPVAQAPVVAATAISAEESFGKIYKEDPDQITKIDMTVKSVSKDAYGALKISFENGQVWKQSDSRRFKIKAGETVYIEKGALGSFMLGKESLNTTIRVKRLD
ncbi:hypothetical protein [Shewanella psychrotolerans]|uniref:hypothetical protein n=1 Tax=Shewanella psychrotolerans TaxID=2864206 RepID=UPI001C65CD26|nr:hypothetical protein [Shewanella psychrotolerans]QYK01067.1 hypothetical protein K0I62_17070 [Shewanella psychrotolerans]